ncbi:tRNA uridine(34) 5-carboxymethylaminomethyl modification radical SAM/GNAT enzyme Elp3 [Candidatus Uhrbacteria bacterium]|nr:tRNA uridine(34) 5-carboxymethylaminomethyl modification radical SAM/GNAT enzyme Elp3 [Candidatus Uhrbacteria bacterium]
MKQISTDSDTAPVSIIHELASWGNITPRSLHQLKKKAAAQGKNSGLFGHNDIRDAYDALRANGSIRKNEALETLLHVKPIRSQSGVVIVTLLTMPYPCPGKCVYCPTEERMPKSYIATEPAAARALALKFDPYTQTRRRIEILERNGHPCDKIEIIIKGGTWSSYPVDYQQWFISECFRAMNDVGGRQRDISLGQPDSPYNRFVGEEKQAWTRENLFEQQSINETARHRCIGLTIETRPDWVSIQEIKRLRSLGVTRVEFGVQSPDDAILKLIKRGHLTKASIHATRLLKDAGIKVDYHLMQGLPGATPTGDLESAQRIFSESDFQPDTIKLYPCVVTPTAKLETWVREGRYVPYTAEQLVPLLASIKSIVPPYVRIARVIRDIPSQEISHGSKATNLRQAVQEYMKAQGLACRCLRCREVGHVQSEKLKTQNEKVKYTQRHYAASGGTEYFLSYESEDESTLFAFLRLRLPSVQENPIIEHIECLRGAALIRELHTYGQLVSINAQDMNASQHKGLGKKLMEQAETVARDAGYSKVAVIAGIGVREYYRKIGYGLEGTYMVKYIV